MADSSEVISLMQPDVPNASCCGEADAYWADEYYTRGSKSYAKITNDRPDDARSIFAFHDRKRGDAVHHRRRQRDRGHRDRGDRAVTGCSAAGEGPVVAMIVAAVPR